MPATTIEIMVPPLPEAVTDATVLAWHVQIGQSVAFGQQLVDLETDKVVLEVPAPSAGIVQTIRTPVGARVTSGDCLAQLSTEPVAMTEEPTLPLIAPSARRLLDELALDASALMGTGKHGRIQKADIMRWLDEREQEQPLLQDPDNLNDSASAHTQPIQELQPDQEHDRQHLERREPISRIRARIAERLLNAQHQAAILTTMNEVDMSIIRDWRARYKEPFQTRHGIKLGLMSFCVKAVTIALQRYPIINAFLTQDHIVYHDYYDIGIAVSTERGLVVPIVRHCERLTLPALEATIAELTRRAQAGTLTIDDLNGGTFSITNGGVFGSLLSTPILNPPQSAILGLHAIIDRPIAHQNQVVIRPMMYTALSYDHRLIDGRDAVSFLLCVKQLLEDPARLLLDV
jgi:2-oxoglutarate dehydrogenase E2 component (dihydrolipoamide succinyltransferase)